jgi:serine phosphatase RsbU (regulator of sigma subunit)
MKSCTNILFFTLCFLINGTFLYSQDTRKIDILEKKASNASKDSNYVKVLTQLSWNLRNSNLPKAFKYNKEALEITLNLKNTQKLPEIYNFRGVLYRNIGDYVEANKCYLEALKIAETTKNATQVAYSYNNLGDVLRLQEKYKDAIYYSEKALNKFIEIKDTTGQAYAYIRMSEFYLKTKEYDKAFECAQKCLRLREILNDKIGVGVSTGRIADIYLEQEKYKKALEDYEKVLQIAKIVDDRRSIISTSEGIAKVYIRTGRYKEAEGILFEILEVAKKVNAKDQVSDIYSLLSELYERSNSFDKAMKYYKLKQATKDSLFSSQRQIQIEQMFVRFETEKKQTENNLLKKNVEQKNIVLTGILIFVVLLLLAGLVLVYNRYRLSKSYQLLSQKNEELDTFAFNLAIANQKIKQTFTQLKLKNESILDSINYAKILQEAILPTPQAMQEALDAPYFVLWKPKDIVSGDFYWVWKNQQKTFIAVVDCTGHGVPGAMMSIIGHNLLNNIIQDQKIHKPARILDKLQKKIQKQFQQAQNKNNDGMAIALCVIDNDAKTLEFAGSQQSLVYIQEGKLNVIKGDKASIGGNWMNSNYSFTQHHIKIDVPSYIYLFSDGYPDQFGGEENMKITTKKFKELLFEIYKDPFENQKELLDEILESWKSVADEDQTDDILVFGMKIK